MWKILFTIWKILFETLLWGCNEDCTRLYSLLHNPLCRSNTTTSVQQEYNSLCNITTARSTVQEGATNVHIIQNPVCREALVQRAGPLCRRRHAILLLRQLLPTPVAAWQHLLKSSSIHKSMHTQLHSTTHIAHSYIAQHKQHIGVLA